VNILTRPFWGRRDQSWSAAFRRPGLHLSAGDNDMGTIAPLARSAVELSSMRIFFRAKDRAAK
jgi:hypothetical protein